MKFNKRLMVGVLAVAAVGVLTAGQVVAAENTLMLFGDGKKALLELVAAIKEG